MDKPFTSKHCTPSRFTSPLNKAGIPTSEGKMESQGELRDLDSTTPGMQEYRAHQANIPQYVPGDSIGGHFNTTMKRMVHNLTGPTNPNLMGGGGGLDLIGGRGLAKGAMNAIKYLFKSGAKTAVKKGTKI